MSYVISNGYRLVLPYVYTTRYKVQENSLKIIEFLLRYFPQHQHPTFEEAISAGRVLCNGSHVSSPDTVVHKSDVINYTLHRHEPEVLADPVDVLHSSDELLVVNKPSSVPVYPVGTFRMNSVYKILKHDSCLQLLDEEYLHTIHRIDRLTSGVLLISRTPEALTKFQSLFQKRSVSKEYIARVKGTFPEGVIEVNQPISRIKDYPILYGISHEGKQACSVFERECVSPDGSESIVRCKPITGRTHQIRVHLEWLGYPIGNDYKYGGDLALSCGPSPVPEIQDYQQENWCPECISGCRATSHLAVEDIRATFIWLHALHYSCTHPKHSWCFESPRPSWSHFSSENNH